MPVGHRRPLIRLQRESVQMPSSASAIDLATHPLTAWKGPLGLPDYGAVRQEDFAPVFEAALAAHNADIERIAADPHEPTIANTLAAFELAGEPLSRVSAIFWCLAGAHTNDAIQALERDIAPKMAAHYSAIYMNDRLFARIDALQARAGDLKLDAETARVLEKTWKRFVRAGAKLKEPEKKRLAAINSELASLGASFGQNVLADEKDWVLFLEEE